MADSTQPQIEEAETGEIDEKIPSKKLSRCSYFASFEHPALCYTENTPKEDLVLEHVKDYERQLMLTYRTDRKLLLYPPNECGVEKFI
jgi:hypothetical protein